MKAVIIAIALFACIAIASADWLVKTPCNGVTGAGSSVQATNGNCVYISKGLWYLVQTSGSTASDFYCTEASCSKCVRERTYNLGSCSGTYTYTTSSGEPTYGNYVNGDYFVAREHTESCTSTVSAGEAVSLNNCYKTSAYGSMQYQCVNNMLVTLNYENSACQGSAYDTTSFSVPSCRSTSFVGNIDYACYKKN